MEDAAAHVVAPGHARTPVSTSDNPLPREMPGLHNILEFAPGVVSGSMPHGEDGFDSLHELGIKTVVSVDAARPQLELARARGIRYVHIPIQYSGIDDDERLAIAKAIRDVEGPVYVHCHHGKHRGPAAVAYGLAANGLISPEEGVALMKEAGTSDTYTGLYACVGTSSPLQDGFITQFGGDLPEVVIVNGIPGGMAELDRAWDNLKLIKAAGWAVPADHPDLVALSEAGVIHNALRVMEHDEETMSMPEDFRRMMTTAVAVAEAMENALDAGGPLDKARADTAFAALAASCKECHAVYRDN